MGWTKGELVGAGFEEIGLPNYTFTLQPEQLQQALNRLDAMMAAWNSQGIRLGYALPSSPGSSSLNSESGLPDAAYQAVVSNLGIRLAPTVGKTASQETKQAASDSYDALLSWCASQNIPEMQLPATLPRGAGNLQTALGGNTFFQPTDPLTSGSDGELVLES
jgi:hypothetical protein